MKRFLILCAVALSLGGCLSTPTGDLLKTTINNPVAPVNIYQAKTIYASTLELVVGYREYCWSKPYAALMADPISKPICQNRRPIVRAMKAADDKAFIALTEAESFVRNNPTIDATAAIRAAISAVSNFQRVTVSAAQSIS